MKRHKAEWHASEARGHFAEVIDGALAGVPQVVRKRSGGEVIVVSKAQWDARQPTLRDLLLAGDGSPEGEDAFDRALREVRREGIPRTDIRDVDLTEE